MLLLGETHGRRDYVYIYEGDALRSVVKNKYKMHLAPPGQNPILFAQFFDLYRDPREERTSESIKYGPAVGAQFGSMIERHLAMRQEYPDRQNAARQALRRASRTSGPKPRRWSSSSTPPCERDREVIVLPRGEVEKVSIPKEQSHGPQNEPPRADEDGSRSSGLECPGLSNGRDGRHQAPDQGCRLRLRSRPRHHGRTGGCAWYRSRLPLRGHLHGQPLRVRFRTQVRGDRARADSLRHEVHQ